MGRDAGTSGISLLEGYRRMRLRRLIPEIALGRLFLRQRNLRNIHRSNNDTD